MKISDAHKLKYQSLTHKLLKNFNKKACDYQFYIKKLLYWFNHFIVKTASSILNFKKMKIQSLSRILIH